MSMMTQKQFEELKELLKKLATDKGKGKDSSGPSVEKIEKGEEGTAAGKAKMERNKKALADHQRRVTLRSEELRLETELNLGLFNRQEAMDGLLKMEDQKHELIKASNTAYSEGNIEKANALQKEIAQVDVVLGKNQKLLKAAKKQTVAQKQAHQSGENLFRGLAGTIGLAKKAQDTFAGKLFKMIKVLSKPGGVKAFFKGIFQGIMQLPFALLDKVIQHTIQLIFALDNAQNAFSAATQQGDKYNQMISDSTFANIQFGISAAETEKAHRTMYESFFAFTQTGPAARRQMGELASRMEKLGVSAESTGKMMNWFNKNLSQTSEDSMESAAQIALLGRNIGISAGRMSRDFLAAIPKLTVYGNRAVGIFGNLAAMAQRSGASMQAMLDVAGKFDTFQGAAEAVGKLNAILGTQMSATEMLMMTEDQRIETLILQVQTSGMAFRDMDRFTQKAIAAAAGISDMNEAQRIFGGSLSDYHEAQELMVKEAEAQEKVDKAVKNALPAKQKLLIAFNQMVSQHITDEFITRMHQFVDWLIKLTEPERFQAWLKTMGLSKDQLVALGEKILWWGGVLGAAYLFLPMLVGGLKSYIMYSKLSKIATNGQVAAEKAKGIILPKNKVQMKMYTKTTKMNTAATQANSRAAFAAAAKIAAVGAAILLAGIGIYIAVKGFVDLANAMSEMKSNVGALVAIVTVITAGFVGMTFALSLMGGASAAAAGPIMAVGFAVLLMGAGVGLAAMGFAVLVMAIGDLNSKGLEAIQTFALLAFGIAAIAAGLLYASGATLAIGTAAIAAAPGLATFTLAIKGIGFALALVAGALALMFDRMAAFGRAIKGTAKDSKAMAGALREAGYAAILNGNPIALAGLAAQTLYAKASKTTVSISGGANLKAMAEGMEQTASLASSFEKVAETMNAIATGINEIDTAIGSGKRRVEIISTLSHLASISTAEVATSARGKTASSINTTQQAIKVEIENKFEDLQLVVDDGKTHSFAAYIRTKSINRKGVA